MTDEPAEGTTVNMAAPAPEEKPYSDAFLDPFSHPEEPVIINGRPRIIRTSATRVTQQQRVLATLHGEDLAELAQQWVECARGWHPTRADVTELEIQLAGAHEREEAQRRQFEELLPRLDAVDVEVTRLNERDEARERQLADYIILVDLISKIASTEQEFTFPEDDSSSYGRVWRTVPPGERFARIMRLLDEHKK